MLYEVAAKGTVIASEIFALDLRLYKSCTSGDRI